MRIAALRRDDGFGWGCSQVLGPPNKSLQPTATTRFAAPAAAELVRYAGEKRGSMPLTDLSEEERSVVLECLRTSLEGPFFPDWEFGSLFGITRTDLARIVAAWPEIDERAEQVDLAINNSMSNLLGYPHGCETAWSQFLSAPRREVERIYVKWRRGEPRDLR